MEKFSTRDNVTTLRYQQELNRHLRKESHSEKSARKEKEKKAASYQSGNDTIIQPTNYKDNSAIMTILNLIIGVVIGVLITCFLVIPSIRQNAVSKSKQAELEANNSLTSRNQEIKSLENKIEELNKKIEDQKKASENSQKIIENYEKLIVTYDAFAQQNVQGAGDMIGNVDAKLLGEQILAIYNNLNTQVNEQYIAVVYTQAEQDYNGQRYAEAVQGLEKVVQVEEDYNDGYAIYYLGQSYRQLGDMENAKKYFQRMVELHPGTSRARRSQQFLNELEQQP